MELNTNKLVLELNVISKEHDAMCFVGNKAMKDGKQIEVAEPPCEGISILVSNSADLEPISRRLVSIGIEHDADMYEPAGVLESGQRYSETYLIRLLEEV